MRGTGRLRALGTVETAGHDDEIEPVEGAVALPAGRHIASHTG